MEISGKSLVIIPIGKYSDYNKARYSYEGETAVAKCTAGLYAKRLPGAHFVFVIQDTLANPQTDFADYDALCLSVEKDFRKWLQASETGVNLAEENYDVIVAPGKGVFVDAGTGQTVRAINTQENQRAWLTQQFVGIFSRFLSAESISVYLDTSHGINSLPLTVAAVLDEILPLCAYRYGYVSLHQLNSDPYPRLTMPELDINTVRQRKVYPDLPFENYNSNDLTKGVFFKAPGNDKLTEQINRKLREIKDDSADRNLQALLASLRYGFPLAVVWLFSELQGKLKPIEPLLGELRKHTVVTRKPGELVIRAAGVLANSMLGDLARLHFLLQVIGDVFPQYTPEQGVPITRIEEAAKKIYLKNQIEMKLIENELSGNQGIRKLVENAPQDSPLHSGEWQLLDSLKRSQGTASTPAFERKVSDRNFYAHAGFEWNVVEVRRQESEIWLRYTQATAQQKDMRNHLLALRTSDRNT
jgi:CRISPR-associated protein Csx1